MDNDSFTLYEINILIDEIDTLMSHIPLSKFRDGITFNDLVTSLRHTRYNLNQLLKRKEEVFYKE